MHIEQFVLEGLGHQSYLITDAASGTAAVVDPRRDIAIYLQAAERAHVTITHVFETHVHNDYLTGAREMVAQTGAVIVTAAEAQVAYAHQGVRDGDRMRVGTLAFAVLATPGHTPDHLSYALYEDGQAQPAAIFSGGSMLIGGAGRTDLVSPGMTLTLTRAQFHSLRRLLDSFPDGVRVYPTHGAGSFCGATAQQGTAHTTTIGQERHASPAALAHDELAFVRQQLASYGVYPRYYASMGEINQQGPRILGSVPEVPALAPVDVQQMMRHGIPLIDGRPRTAFARAHVPGAFNVECDPSFAIYVGWLLPFNKPLMLVVDDATARQEAAWQLLRIGFEQVLGHLAGGMPAWKRAGMPTQAFNAITLDELARRYQRHEPLAILDVRDETEWRAGHIPGAQHLHIGDLPQHLNELPLDVPIVTICQSGFRSAMAASMVAALGRETLAVQQGGVGDWIARGLPTERHVATPAMASSESMEHAHP